MTKNDNVQTLQPQPDPLLQPFTIKKLTLRNRIMSTSHADGHGNPGLESGSLARYHAEKAKGGIALTMFGGSSNVSPDSPDVFGQLDISTDRIIPHFQRFSESVHAHGAALMCQITHLGRRGDPHSGHWLSTIAPSRVRETVHRSIPKEMDEHDILRVVREYGEAAWRCREGGLDGIETLTSGHLTGQFLSPMTNRRQDNYGGSLENRLRFVRMVYEEMRRRVGDDFVVGIRYMIDEYSPGWLTAGDALRAAQILEQDGTIDFFNLTAGRIDTERKLAEECMPGMEQPHAPFLEEIGQFRSELKSPVFHAARIIDIATARQAVQDGLLDMVAMTRAHIADPHLVRKLAQGQAARIRPCVGATFCQAHNPATCLHNPSTSREDKVPHEIAAAAQPNRKVVIVGGGVAGLEAARVSALRGHDVVLFEAADRLGGQVNVATQVRMRQALSGVVAWREAELGHLHVDVRLNQFVSEADVLAEQPDVVIVATGGKPDVMGFAGAEHCRSVWDMLRSDSLDRTRPATILVYDGLGKQPAPTCAIHLAEKGHNVTFAALDGRLAEEMGYAERVMYRKQFHTHAIPIHTDLHIHRVEQQGESLKATFVNELTDIEHHFIATHVVVEQGTMPVDALYHSLRAQSCNDGVTDINALLAGIAQPRRGAWASDGFELHRIGDAVSSRSIHAAVYDALRLCQAL
ncbi:MAG: NADH:flavin oxidoreductase [Chloroflexota bacterium]